MKIVQFSIIFLASLFIVTPALALTTSFTVVAPTPAPTKIDYALPYPGILPDNPLYFLKIIRDRILEFLIMDPVKKAEFYVLQSDKHLGMGMTLFNQGKAQLAQETISKGEKYMVLAESTTFALKNSGKEIPGYLLDRLTKSSSKHEEIIKGLVTKATGQQLQGLEESLALLQKIIADTVRLK